MHHTGALVQQAEAIAEKRDGHLSLTRFTTGWKVLLATPDLDSGQGRQQVWELEMLHTLAEALQALISRN